MVTDRPGHLRREVSREIDRTANGRQDGEADGLESRVVGHLGSTSN